MVKDKKKSDGPSCACGKTDLYEGWKKNNDPDAKSKESEAVATSEKEDKKKDKK